MGGQQLLSRRPCLVLWYQVISSRRELFKLLTRRSSLTTTQEVTAWRVTDMFTFLRGVRTEIMSATSMSISTAVAWAATGLGTTISTTVVSSLSPMPTT